MKERISIADFQQDAATYVKRVTMDGVVFVLEQDHRPVATISPIRTRHERRAEDLPALLASLPRLSPGEAEAFARDLDEARYPSDAGERLRDPWDS